MATPGYGRSTFLEIYGASSARATPLPTIETSCKPRTTANTTQLSRADNKTEQRPFAEQYTTDTQHNNEMAPPQNKAVPPHKRHAPANRWPNKKDFPKPEPRRKNWEADWDTPTAGKWSADKQDSWGSDNQDEWGTAATAGGANLGNWDGSFAPAPLDWDSRPAFRPEQSEAQVQRWLDNSETVLPDSQERGISVKDAETINGTAYTFATSENATLMGDIVPRYWIPVLFGRTNPQTFWEELVKSDTPQPQDENDLDGVRPWWELLQGRQFLEDLCKSHPDIAGIDPDETKEERLARENDDGGINRDENRRKYIAAVKQANQAKNQRKVEREKKLLAKACNSERARNNQRLRPSVPKMFIRSARPEDMAAVRDIYNYYVQSSCATPETEDRTRDDMVQRYSDAVFSKLPFIVACEKGEVIKPRKKKGKIRFDDEDIVLPDKVIGFAVAEDYNDMKGVYRYTAQVEVYTDYRYYMKGVASCLMDKITALLDPDFLERGGYEVRGDELEGKEPQRVIKTILMHCPFEKPERLEWMTRWLNRSLNFEQVGQLDGVGTKLGRSVSLAIFSRPTGAVVDHANPPPPVASPKCDSGVEVAVQTLSV